jgi:hypothetical protein
MQLHNLHSYNAILTFLRIFLALQILVCNRELRIVQIFVVTIGFIE